LAARTLRSGMTNGITSPARPWFSLGLADKGLEESGAVKFWLHDSTDRILSALQKSNFYQCIPNLYGDIAAFAIGAMAVEEDFESIVRFYNYAPGRFWVANDAKGRVREFSCDISYSARQIVERFAAKDKAGNVTDWSNISPAVRSAYENSTAGTRFDVEWYVGPNPEADPSRLEARFKKFCSLWKEKNGPKCAGNDGFLRRSGFDRFPVLVGRWDMSGEDEYGSNCPGIEALGDAKALQVLERRKAQLLEKKINPPLVADATLEKKGVGILPGFTNFTANPKEGIKAIHEIQGGLADVEESIREHEKRIRATWFADLFQMLTNSDRREITAEEIRAREQEKMVEVGPVLSRLDEDILDPVIGLVFGHLWDQGLLLPPPPELQGAGLKVEYISVMAQAQKLSGIGSLERFVGFAGQLAAASPEAADKVNLDKVIDVAAAQLSIQPGVVRSDEETAAIRQRRAQQMQAQAQQEAMANQARAAKDLSQADTGGQNALTELLKAAQPQQ
jgi:hypothetical protein